MFGVGGEMNEVGAPGSDFFDECERLGKTEVGGMLTLAKRVDDEGIDSFQQLDRAFRNDLVIGDICERPEPIP